jgi:hypothetical protein
MIQFALLMRLEGLTVVQCLLSQSLTHLLSICQKFLEFKFRLETCFGLGIFHKFGFVHITLAIRLFTALPETKQ